MQKNQIHHSPVKLTAGSSGSDQCHRSVTITLATYPIRHSDSVPIATANSVSATLILAIPDDDTEFDCNYYYDASLA